MHRCKSCQAPIRWAKTKRGNGVPLNWDPIADGEWQIVNGVIEKADESTPSETPRYRTHFATCPFAGSHRSKKSAGRR